MSLHPIFDDAPKKFADDHTFRIRLGSQVNGQPKAHKTLRITTGDPTLADDIAELLGGTPASWDTSTEEDIEVLTETALVEVIFENIRHEFLQWGKSKQPIRACDGYTQQDDLATTCYCRDAFPELRLWKAGAKRGTACQPTTKASVRLAAKPDLGMGRFQSTAWSLLKGDPIWLKDKMPDGEVWQPPITELEAALAAYDGRALGTLELKQVQFENAAKEIVKFSKPVFTIIGPVPVDALVAG